MSAANPRFHNIARAPYEFGHLIRMLPGDFPAGQAMSSDERQQAQAAIAHAKNANVALMDGIEAIGHLLFSAANNPEYPPSGMTLENLAGLIKHIAVEAQFVQEQQADLQAAVDQDDRRAAASPLRQKAGAKAAAAESAGTA